MTQHTLEEYFKLHQNKPTDFSVRVGYTDDNRWFFLIYPNGLENEAWSFQVEGNRLICINPESPKQDEICIKKICNFMDNMSELVRATYSNRLLSQVEAFELFLKDYEGWKNQQRDSTEQPSGDSC